MKHLSVLAVGILLLAAPALAQEKPAKPAADKTLTAAGVVSAVSADSLTIKAKTTEWTFTVDKATQVKAVGASRKTAALKDEKKPAQITEYVKVGDSVTVNYHETGTTKHAASVVVRGSLPAAKK
jgi:hypothetical protein